MKRPAAWFAAAVLFAGVSYAADDTPAWLREAAEIQTPKYAASASAVVLMNEESLAVEESGRIITTTRYAVRILTEAGKSAAAAHKVYITGTGKVREIRAWTILQSGTVKKYAKERVLDVALVENDVYNEVRAKLLSGSGDADAGAVFGYEAVLEDHAMFLQSEWLFQGHRPVVLSRYSVSLPEGWRAESVTFNSEPLEPRIAANKWTWEMRDLKAIYTGELASPGVMALAPRIAVTFVPAVGAKTGSARAFTKWPEVSRWLAELTDQQAVSSPALDKKAMELTAGAKTGMEKAEAIARFVQSVNYVSIQTGVGRGGGYRPHTAAAVFAKSYGDCKDKANLMRTMLKTIGVDAFLTAIYSGDRTYVREAWASPQQFNHMIVAVRMKEGDAAAMVPETKLGRLLMFDPTDPYTPFGYLPEHEQDSFALLVAPEGGDLVRMPVSTPTANRLQRQTEVVLGELGDITATVQEVSTGEAAASARRLFRRSSASAYRKIMEQWVTAGVKGANVTRLDPTDSPGEFKLDIAFSAAQYGQSMQRKLLVFKPVVVSRRDAMRFTAMTRRYPIILNSEAYTEVVRVKLPAGFKVDEKPKNANVETAFGKYRATFESKDGELLFTRSMEVRTTTVPASEYPKVRDFYRRVQAAEGEPVVLVRQ